MPSVSMTPAAVANLRRLQEEYEMPGFGLRFGITGGGCSGYKYVLELEEEPVDGDEVIEVEDGVRVFLHADHHEKLKNSVIDWVDTLMEQGFRIQNPQARNACGCGESVNFEAGEKPAEVTAGEKPAEITAGEKPAEITAGA